MREHSAQTIFEEICARAKQILQPYTISIINKSSPAATTLYVWVRFKIKHKRTDIEKRVQNYMQ